jgi:hypothetical protein
VVVPLVEWLTCDPKFEGLNPSIDGRKRIKELYFCQTSDEVIIMDWSK